MHILERAHVYTHIRTHKKCAQQPKQSSAHCSTDGKVLMVKLQWYVPILAPRLCLRDTFPKKFPHQLSPKKYGKQENSQHLLIVIGVLARHWQVSTPCDMLPSQLCLMQTDALQSVSKFKHTSVHSQSKHRQADKQFRIPQNQTQQQTSEGFWCHCVPNFSYVKRFVDSIVGDSFPSACVLYFEVTCLDKIRAAIDYLGRRCVAACPSVTFLFPVQVNSNGTLLA